MFSSRCFSPIGRFVGAILLALAIVALPLAAAAAPLDRTAVVAGAAAPGLVASLWNAVLDFLSAETGGAGDDRGAFQAKCGVIPDPSGICKNGGEPSTPSPRPEPARAIVRN